MSDYWNQVAEATSSILSSIELPPKVGIILGTGSGEIANELKVETAIEYGSIPHFPTSTALGHKGRLVFGEFADTRVVALQGRFHLYEGYSYQQVTLPIHVLARLGIELLLISNAAGGINPKFSSGEIMLIESHLDFMFQTSPTLFNGLAPRGQRRVDTIMEQKLHRLVEAVARQNEFVVHRGVYAGLLGPNYETRAEYRMLRRIGGDVAGMSTLPELTVATKYGIPCLACSIVTNVAKPDVLEPTSGQEVVDAAKVAAPNLLKIFEAAARSA